MAKNATKAVAFHGMSTKNKSCSLVFRERLAPAQDICSHHGAYAEFAGMAWSGSRVDIIAAERSRFEIVECCRAIWRCVAAVEMH
jgi:hypothetical protein